VSSAQDRLVLSAQALAESAWLFAIFGVISLMLGGNGSPLGWLAVLAIMSMSLLVASFLQMIAMPVTMGYVLQGLAGVVVVYLAVGSQVSPAFQGVDLGWLGTMNSEFAPEDFRFRAIMGSLTGAFVWWRGGHLASTEFPVESLAFSFKMGVAVLGLAVVVDIAHQADLNTFPMMFIFFAASLAGLSIGHVLPASRQATEERAWLRVIGGVVAIVLVLGLMFSLLQRNVISMIAAPLLIILNAMATVVFYLIIFPLAYLVDFLTRIVFSLLGGITESQQEPPLMDPGGLAGDLQALQEGTAENPIASAILQIGQWAIAAIIILIALILLARAFQRRRKRRRAMEDGERESIREDADPAYDFARLLFGLIPSRFKKARQRHRLRLPQDDPDIVDVFRIYFGLLTLAEERGHPRQPHETPGEYQRTLEILFPQSLARTATAAFIRACYGRHPATREQIEEMRITLEQVASGKRDDT
jgi:hypothetical protein